MTAPRSEAYVTKNMVDMWREYNKNPERRSKLKRKSFEL